MQYQFVSLQAFLRIWWNYFLLVVSIIKNKFDFSCFWVISIWYKLSSKVLSYIFALQVCLSVSYVCFCIPNLILMPLSWRCCFYHTLILRQLKWPFWVSRWISTFSTQSSIAERVVTSSPFVCLPVCSTDFSELAQ